MKTTILLVVCICLIISLSSLVHAQQYEVAPGRIEKVIEIIQGLENTQDAGFGGFTEQTINITNIQNGAIALNLRVSGAIEGNTLINETLLMIPGKSIRSVNLKFLSLNLSANNSGELIIDGETLTTIPITITARPKEQSKGSWLMLEIKEMQENVYTGRQYVFRLFTTSLNAETEFNATLIYTLKRSGAEELIEGQNMLSQEEDVLIKGANSLIRSIDIPKDLELGDYILEVTAEYFGEEAQTSTFLVVSVPLYKHKLFGKVPVWVIILILALILLGFIIFKIIKKHIEANKRFHVKVEYDKLPQPGDRSLTVGRIAETDKKAYFDMDSLTVHTIVAGSTGGGKSISAQVIIEECLLKNVAVAIFDPTAQWSGMLRKLEDKKMLEFYPIYGMKKSEARAFPGNVRAIESAREKINLLKYMKPGEIQIFTLNKLDPKDMDFFVANVVREIFSSNLQETRGLTKMLAFDEIHRILPKFGGSGSGFLQIERSCREFRKWGIGVMLISQVLSDFVGEIKANINTEVQMKTRDEGDLNRIKLKYGESYIQELIKSPVGTGMVQNNKFNNGIPYYIQFRPILHSVIRLTDEELAEYNKYNQIIDNLEYSLDQLEENKIDVFDLRLELKLSKDKVKSGNFNMVKIYLEGLTPRIDKAWQKLGKTPKQKELELIDEVVLREEMEKARKLKAEQDVAKKKIMADRGEEEKFTFKTEASPDVSLTLPDGTLVISLDGLISELIPMKAEKFQAAVNEKQNMIADWVKKAFKREDIEKELRPILEKDAFLKKMQELKEKVAKEAEGGDKKKEEAT
ncbi:DUF87 domain-containing protein [Candidatus Woesearchaeota archaeon]|nr:MAG: hypothetical protein QS99_C0015G0041 [archaeon GW2011_AR4]MBS3130125.1 DUF87 domain-containing protein [Candidatus Woesearchaeota archaeon]HIH38742.1 DUF87 domain-containing protein [Candidatus Woesearchaeota archaeon]HIH48085.1 DUF87 domain-containing protein [Candidatus Woesearchaeota archaeon]HIJ04275.1 DUF87 domain-containing protein [Candidatus Woesearchaeota archaeon]